MRTRLTWLLAIVALLALGTAACSGDDEEPTAAATTVATEEAHDDDEDADDHEELTLFDETASQSIVVEMQDIKFVPETITVQAGEIVELMLENTGSLPHDFTIDQIDADHAYHESVEVAGHGEHEDEFGMHHALEGGHDLAMRLRVHEPGEYEFWCTVPGHRDAGMIGTLIVE